MKAIQFTEYGTPEVLTEVEADVPEPRRDQVRVRVAATSINSVDVLSRSGGLRFLARARPPFGTGIDVVGIVDSVGAHVTRYTPGDRVWGVRANASHARIGTVAQYALLPSTAVATAPTGVTPSEAIASLVPAMIASIAVEKHAVVGRGDTVIVRGAAGGMGAAIVQLAVHRGARVIGVARREAAEFVLGLGAAEVVDYRDLDLGDLPPADAVIDTVGTDLRAWRRRLNRSGRMVTTAVGSLAAMGAVAASVPAGRGRIRAFVGQPAPMDIERAAHLVTDRIVSARIAGEFGLHDIVDAHRRFEAGGTLGRLVVSP